VPSGSAEHPGELGADPTVDRSADERARGQADPTSRAERNALRRSRSDQARARGQVAGDRAAELRERQVQLRLGAASTVEDLVAAREALAEGLRQAELALERAGEAYERAAEAHDRVARYLEQLALSGGPGAPDRTARALRHRTAAQADRDAGRRDASGAEAGTEPPA
jgi:hypothetical protein